MITVPSLNIPGGLHNIVVVTTIDKELLVFDPQKGRDGKKFYNQDTLKSWCGVKEFIPNS
jgi:hypothetical protein